MTKKKRNPRKTAVLKDEHVEFLESENINFSALTRDLLDRYIKHKRQDDDFTLTK